jgi:RimJ/RimL family protein N-acetyltransferase
VKIVGKLLDFQTIRVDDAPFVFELRQGSKRTQYLSKIIGTVDIQVEWIKRYKFRETNKQEFYFVILSKTQEKLGLVRLYDFQGHSFSWGSWLIREDAPSFTAIASALQVYEFAFYTLGFEQSHFEVQKGNDKVKAFHERFGAMIVGENEQEYHFCFAKQSYEKTKLKYKRYV